MPFAGWSFIIKPLNTPFFHNVSFTLFVNSILFHDIGKCYLPEKKTDEQALKSDKKTDEQETDEHALMSNQIIKKHWAELGIKTQRIASVISLIVISYK